MKSILYLLVTLSLVPATQAADYDIVINNGLPSTGIPNVLVNGAIVVKDSNVLDDVRPGQPIRYPVEETRVRPPPD